MLTCTCKCKSRGHIVQVRDSSPLPLRDRIPTVSPGSKLLYLPSHLASLLHQLLNMVITHLWRTWCSLKYFSGLSLHINLVTTSPEQTGKGLPTIPSSQVRIWRLTQECNCWVYVHGLMLLCPPVPSHFHFATAQHEGRKGLRKTITTQPCSEFRRMTVPGPEGSKATSWRWLRQRVLQAVAMSEARSRISSNYTLYC